MAWARHGKCESDTAALCKSNGKDTFYTLSGTAWQGTACARHAMCESAFTKHLRPGRSRTHAESHNSKKFTTFQVPYPTFKMLKIEVT